MKDLWIKTESMIFKADRVGYDKLNDDTFGIICFTELRGGHYHAGFSFVKFKTENECKAFLNHISDFLMSDEVVFNAEYVLKRWFKENAE